MIRQPTVVVDASALSLRYVGLGVFTRRLIKLLAPLLGDKLVVLINEESQQLLPVEGLSIRTYSSKSLLPGLLKNYVCKHRASTIARREFPDAIFLSPTPMWAPLLPRHTVVVLHDLIYRRFAWYEGAFFIRRFLNRLCEATARKSQATVTVSEFSRQEIIDTLHIPEHRVVCIPNWIEDAFIESAETVSVEEIRKRYGLPEKFWLYLGGYDYRKNVETLLEAYAIASKHSNCPPLVLAGAIPQEKARTLCDVLETIDRLDLSSDIIMPGIIAAEDLAGVYKAASLFVFPSKFEGFGYPPLEANACGTPALVAANSSLTEIVPTQGNHFDESSPGQLADILARVVEGTLEVPTFSWDRYTEEQAGKNWMRFLSHQAC